jgi:hypothetical protein
VSLGVVQRRVAQWIKSTFGPEYITPAAAQERGLRVAEEAIELAQSLGVDQDTMNRLVTYVYQRPAGEPAKELAQCLVTLCGCAEALDLSLLPLVNNELNRIETPEIVARCRERQAQKRAALLATPEIEMKL